MCIFTLDQWLLESIILAIFFTAFITVVHWAEDVSLTIATCLFILNRTAWVFSLNPVVSSFEVRTITSFITQRPEDDTWVVETTLYVALVTFHVCLSIVSTFSQSLFTITQTVRFDIGFSYHIDTILVTKFIEEVVVWIVASTYSVEVELLHDLDVLNHSFTRYVITSIWIQFMTVSTLEQYRLAVNQQLCVLDFNLTETYILWNNFQHLVASLQCSTQCIEVRSFSSPLSRVFYVQCISLLA